MACESMYRTVRVNVTDEVAAKAAAQALRDVRMLVSYADGALSGPDASLCKLRFTRLYEAQALARTLAVQHWQAFGVIEGRGAGDAGLVFVYDAGTLARVATVDAGGTVKLSLEAFGPLDVTGLPALGVELALEAERHGGHDHVHAGGGVHA